MLQAVSKREDDPAWRRIIPFGELALVIVLVGVAASIAQPGPERLRDETCLQRVRCAGIWRLNGRTFLPERCNSRNLRQFP
jgi:hypothetical protein